MKMHIVLKFVGHEREKPYSNDIDILLTKFGSKEKDKEKHLSRFVKRLKKHQNLIMENRY